MLKRLTRRVVFVCIVAIALVVPLRGVPARAADPFEINVIVSLTGPFAFIGKAEALSVQTVVDLTNKAGGINGQQIKLNVVDDQSNPATAVQLASQILAKKPAVLLGPTYLASCLAIKPLIDANGGPVTYCFAPTITPAAGSWFFSGGTSSGDQAIATMRFLEAKGWKKVAMITTTDATGQTVEKGFADQFSSGKYPGMTLLDTEHFAQTDTSVAAQIAKMKALNPDVILDATTGTSTGTVLRQIKDEGIELPIMSTLGNVVHAQIDQYTTIMPKEIYFVAPGFVARDVTPRGPVRDAQQAFYKALNAQGLDPDVGYSQSWDPTLVMIDALKHLGTNANAKQVLDYIEKIKHFPATDGYYDYTDGSQRGIGLDAVVVCRWDAGKKTWVAASGPGGKPLPK